MPTTLPRPEVKVITTSDGKDHLVISRDDKVAKSFELQKTGNERVIEAVRGVIDDAKSAELLP